MLCTIKEKQQAVDDVNTAYSAVDVETEQVQMRIVAPNGFLDAFCYDMIGYAAEGLQADNAVYALLCQLHNVARQQPAFASLGSG